MNALWYKIAIAFGSLCIYGSSFSMDKFDLLNRLTESDMVIEKKQQELQVAVSKHKEGSVSSEQVVAFQRLLDEAIVAENNKKQEILNLLYARPRL